MPRSLLQTITTILLSCIFVTTSFAQAIEKSKLNKLYSAGYASAFIGGLYDVHFPYKQILNSGDFGLGAPEHLDGELLIYKGVLYQTRYTGETKTISVNGNAPYAISCFFKADKVLSLKGEFTKNEFYKFLDSVNTHHNGMYAIHVAGNFKQIKTRAFPAAEKPYQPLAELLANQRFFEFNNVKGDLVGFNLPDFLQGPFIAGYHFHFLSDNKAHGGHIVDFIAEDVTIEIDELHAFSLDLPQTQEFRMFDFKKDRSNEIKSVETGKKN